MKNFYFTFGQNHENVDGISMENKWVRVTALSKRAAYNLFIFLFANPEMGNSQKWSMIYSEDNFNPEFYSEGEHSMLHQEELLNTVQI